MIRLISISALALLFELATSACALDTRYVKHQDAAMPSPVAASEIAQRVILVGDAGEAERDDPVLAEMKRVAAGFEGARTTIIFLGDNIYPSGMPPRGHPGYDSARLRLEA